MKYYRMLEWNSSIIIIVLINKLFSHLLCVRCLSLWHLFSALLLSLERSNAPEQQTQQFLWNWRPWETRGCLNCAFLSTWLPSNQPLVPSMLRFSLICPSKVLLTLRSTVSDMTAQLSANCLGDTYDVCSSKMYFIIVNVCRCKGSFGRYFKHSAN